MLDVLHWISFQNRITDLLWETLLGLTPGYLRDLCCTTSSSSCCASLCSTEQGVFIVPIALPSNKLIVSFTHRTATKQNRAFSVIGPLLGNGLPLTMRLFHRVQSDSVYAHLKLYFSATLRSGALLVVKKVALYTF